MFTDEQLENMVHDPVAREELKSYLLKQKKLIEGRDKENSRLRDIIHDYEKIVVENKKLLKLIKSADANMGDWIMHDDGTFHLMEWGEKVTKLLDSLNKKR